MAVGMGTAAQAFRDQAASDLRVFALLRSRALASPGEWECHALHYLQMASEKCCKAMLLAARVMPMANGKPRPVHEVFMQVYRWRLHPGLSRYFQAPSGCTALRLTRGTAAMLRYVETLNPTVARRLTRTGAKSEERNAEYPWEATGTAHWVAPCRTGFGVFGHPKRAQQIAEAERFLLGVLRQI
jgi:hypothetical protein